MANLRPDEAVVVDGCERFSNITVKDLDDGILPFTYGGDFKKCTVGSSDHRPNRRMQIALVEGYYPGRTSSNVPSCLGSGGKALIRFGAVPNAISSTPTTTVSTPSTNKGKLLSLDDKMRKTKAGKIALLLSYSGGYNNDEVKQGLDGPLTFEEELTDALLKCHYRNFNEKRELSLGARLEGNVRKTNI